MTISDPTRNQSNGMLPGETVSGIVQDRLVKQAGVAELTGEEFADSLDVVRASQLFRKCLVSSDRASPEAEAAASKYCELADYWEDCDPIDEGEPQTFLNETEIVEIAGQIKWFDASRGYGFITPDDRVEDVLLHVTCLRAGGFQTAYEGARIHIEALVRPKGLQAYRILFMDNSTAIHPDQLPQRTHVIVEPESDWERALVKWYNRVRGFGFLTRGEGTPDVFVHMETLRRFGFAELRPGQAVQIRWGHGYKGCMVAEMRPDPGSGTRDS
jgi:cold shock protein